MKEPTQEPENDNPFHEPARPARELPPLEEPSEEPDAKQLDDLDIPILTNRIDAA